MLDVEFELLTTEGFLGAAAGRRVVGVVRMLGIVTVRETPLELGTGMREGEACILLGVWRTGRAGLGVVCIAGITSEVGSSSESRRSAGGGVFNRSS